jgi:hypothetical protein
MAEINEIIYASKEDYINAIKPHIEMLKAAIINSSDRMIMVKVT